MCYLDDVEFSPSARCATRVRQRLRAERSGQNLKQTRAQGSLVEGIADKLPGATFRLFERTGHPPFFEEPEEFASALVDWMSRSAGDLRALERAVGIGRADVPTALVGDAADASVGGDTESRLSELGGGDSGREDRRQGEGQENDLAHGTPPFTKQGVPSERKRDSRSVLPWLAPGSPSAHSASLRTELDVVLLTCEETEHIIQH